MRRYWRLFAAIAVVVLAAIGIHNLREKRAEAKRYQTVLRTYSGTLKPGMTRKEVEDHFHANGIVFRQMCCVNTKKSMGVWDDLVKIAQEDPPPFVCSEKNIYIAFQFAGSRSPDRAPGWSGEASDKLIAVSLYPWLEGCL